MAEQTPFGLHGGAEPPRAVRELLHLWAAIQALTTHVVCNPADEAVVRHALETDQGPLSPFLKVHVRPESKPGEILVLQPGALAAGYKNSPMMN